MMPRKIKLFWRVGAVLAALTAVAVAAAVLVPRMGVSDLYRRYEGNPHLDVTYLRNFPVNDTLAVDVTLLQARDDEGWDILKEDFRVVPPLEFIQKKIDSGKDIVEVSLAPKDDPTLPMDKKNILKNNVVGVSRLKRTISIFTTDTKEQQLAVMHYNYWK